MELERKMAQKKIGFAMTGKTFDDCLLDEKDRDDSVTAAGIAAVRERAASSLAGRTLRSVYDANRVVVAS